MCRDVRTVKRSSFVSQPKLKVTGLVKHDRALSVL